MKIRRMAHANCTVLNCDGLPPRRRHPGLRGLLLASLLLLGLASIPHAALAVCAFTSGSATTVTFNAGTITLKLDQQPSTTTPIWTSNSATPANPPVLSCDGGTPSGNVNTIAGPPMGGDDTLFPTGIPGISYRITYTSGGTNVVLPKYPNYLMPSIIRIPYKLDGTSTLELFYTGPYLPSNNSTLSGELSRWKVNICDDPKIGSFFGIPYYAGCNGVVASRPVGIFNINAIFHIDVPTCDVDPGSVKKTVSLPGTSTVRFTGPGSTAGKTPFTLQLTNCSPNLGVFISLNTNNPSRATGVIAPTQGAGYATGIGVRLLQSDSNGVTAPVTFGDTTRTGTTSGSNSDYAIKLYAQYYQTGDNVSAGNVKAIATYTIQYQ